MDAVTYIILIPLVGQNVCSKYRAGLVVVFVLLNVGLFSNRVNFYEQKKEYEARHSRRFCSILYVKKSS